MPLADTVAGTRFGTLVHDVLERVDPTTQPLEPHLRAEINRALGRDRMALDRGALESGLAAAIRTPLGAIAGGRSLADIAVSDRLAELDFELALCGGTASIPARRIGEVLLDTLPEGDPQRVYAESLAAGRFALDFGGYLRGSIDAVLRVDVDGVTRHLVVDYKTNRLHRRDDPNPLAAYHPALLPAAMAASDYVLQGLLYTVAVHRFLRSRLAGYDPSLHLGGIAYLYVRGMVGPATPVVAEGVYGVFAWTPPVASILALDELFAGGTT
jgi:exodeoxyribonuclease V beta subunit